jgi:hypothetical protein
MEPIPMTQEVLSLDAARAAQPRQHDLFGTVHPPVLAAWGAGVDSTAMLIELVERGEFYAHLNTSTTYGA